MSVSTNKAPLVLQLAAQLGMKTLKLVGMMVAGWLSGLALGFMVVFIWVLCTNAPQAEISDSAMAVWETFIWVLAGLGAFAGAGAGMLRLIKSESPFGQADTRPRPARIRTEVACAIVASQTGADVSRISVGLFEDRSLSYGRMVRLGDSEEKQLEQLLGDVAVLVTGVNQSEFVAARRRMKPLFSSIDERLSEIQVRAALAGPAGQKYLDRGAVLAAAVRLSAEALDEAPRGLADRLEHEMSRRLHMNSDQFYAIRNELVLSAERAAANAKPVPTAVEPADG